MEASVTEGQAARHQVLVHVDDDNASMPPQFPFPLSRAVSIFATLWAPHVHVSYSSPVMVVQRARSTRHLTWPLHLPRNIFPLRIPHAMNKSACSPRSTSALRPASMNSAVASCTSAAATTPSAAPRARARIAAGASSCRA